MGGHDVDDDDDGGGEGGVLLIGNDDINFFFTKSNPAPSLLSLNYARSRTSIKKK